VGFLPRNRVKCTIYPRHGGYTLPTRPGELSAQQMDFADFQMVKSTTEAGHDSAVKSAVVLVRV
jgi:hypothetical protein